MQPGNFECKFFPNPVILICGDRFSGRSTLCSRLMQNFGVFEWEIYCGTRDREQFWDGKTQAELHVSRYTAEKFTTANHPTGLVFDEVLDWNHGTEEMVRLFSHQVCPIIVTTPTIQLLPEFILNNVEYVFCLRLRLKEWKRVLSEFYYDNDNPNILQTCINVTEEDGNYNSIVFSPHHRISILK